MPLESCTGGHGASKSSRDPKTVDYSPRKWVEMRKITSFDDAARVLYRGSRGIDILPGPKNRQKYAKSRVWILFVEFFGCFRISGQKIIYRLRGGGDGVRVPGASKSSRDPKTVDYSPRKWPEIRKITSFDSLPTPPPSFTPSLLLSSENFP